MNRHGLRARAAAAVAAAMAQWATTEMRWGTDDCKLAVADIVRDVTGRDPARRYRGRYTTRLGAARALGGRGVEGAARDSARALHWRKIKPRRARPGDVGLVLTVVRSPSGKRRTAHAAVICRAPGWFVGRGERGFAGVAAKRVSFAWSIA